MKFRAVFSTDDGRLTKGNVYRGAIISHVPQPSLHDNQPLHELRICVFDNQGEWMTFDPKAFEPEPNYY